MKHHLELVPSGRPRPSDKGDGGGEHHPDPEIRWGPSLKIFSFLLASVWSKNKVGGARAWAWLWALLHPPLVPAFLYFIYSLYFKMRCGRHAVGVDYKYSSLLLSSGIEPFKYMSEVKVTTCEMTCQVVTYSSR